MPSKCEILFDTNVDRVVFSGQMLTGRIVLTFDQEESVKSTYRSIDLDIVSIVDETNIFSVCCLF